MAHWVKCLFCGKTFDADNEEFVMPNSRRYAHKICAENHIDYKSKIHAFMKEKLNSQYSYTKIESQIKKIKAQDKIDDKIIYETLVYWYNILGNSTEKANGGIGIVPYVYSQYLKWAKEQENNSKINKNKRISDYVNKNPRVVEGVITPLKKPRHVKYYELD